VTIALHLPRGSAPEDLENFFQFGPYLPDYLLTLAHVCASLISRELLSGAADCKPLFIQKAADLANNQDVLALIVAAVTTTFNRFELGKFLFPITQHVRFDTAQITNLAYREIAFPRNRREYVVISGFQHMLLLET
jgi:hypothetical protein